MRNFFNRLDDAVVSKEVKELMIKAQSFNKVMTIAAEGIGLSSHTVNSFYAQLCKTSLSELIPLMKENGFYLTVTGGKIRIENHSMVEDEMTHKDVIYHLMDTIDTLGK